jgi:hypothetical protein
MSGSSRDHSAAHVGVSEDTEPDLGVVKDLICSATHPSFVFCEQQLSLCSDHGIDLSILQLQEHEFEEAIACHLLNGRSVCE